jgi:NADPH:quinone reductase-like Zn-dependent oxidoreductase
VSRAVIHETFGGPEVLRLREVPEPHAGAGEVRVRVTAAGLNPMDWSISSRSAAAARFGITVPSGFGSDFAGVVDEVGVVPIAAVFPIERVRDAVTLQAGRHVHGKVVITL